ncbi:hypothetical protein Z945_875 [Sulfitobacter noctilucae]|uniref:phage holin family protein n=1 Tax=Sulfitobacter noctilucae TaxID=1342302 RepID=UPI000469CFE5|nr:phage holin family protein [Sulfitobacter noctilucae]KIN65828.1 hypothetical protein Z945_875 [Sulfitobacter noctilucae]
MIAGLIHQAQRKASRTARKAAFGAGGAICIGIGLGFLTAAAWLFLITVTTSLNTALIIGGVYTGLGLILVGIASAGEAHEAPKSKPQQASKPASHEPGAMVPELIAAFTSGLAAGQKTRSGSS